jgi:predicted Zn-dependent protease
MIEGMQMLESQQRSRPIDFFSTHPSPENRIAYLEQKIQSSYSLAGLRVGKEDYYRYVLRRFND